MNTFDLERRLEHLETLVTQIAAAQVGGPSHALMTRLEAAVYARVGKTLLDEAIRTGELNAVHKGRRVILRRSDIDAWLSGMMPTTKRNARGAR